ncbi:MAG: hypothetical protein AUJ28_03170 [Parcubacteria group bacterium CG1_02_37_51]|uniref:Uncharacterized protein n=2 Tax=Candidatus Komeiliibacteriota TaxID=1817908 RepID=A0A2M8DQP1_9BACT|nr:MAG: hypothetical protein AUJ28_03170 [Parcubacteria group bacterium CG1_02_37_51]PIY95291.1 MAG: hypothetical protein COY67_00740 [Candidatus Komeilibacteria bacterium CG_4_10_14_0_8_um_filter_37_78]PJC01532.1 MAG: hypothetical protein CO073_03350 [Candidatus Komeilibacteria bacterium CG_4_9_14_0_8_um_filter_36_9]
MVNIFAVILLTAMAVTKMIYLKFPTVYIWRGYRIRIVILVYMALATISFLVVTIAEGAAAGVAVNIIGGFGWWLPTIIPKAWKWLVKTVKKPKNAKVLLIVVAILIAINIPMATSYIVVAAILILLLGYLKKKINKIL